MHNWQISFEGSTYNQDPFSNYKRRLYGDSYCATNIVPPTSFAFTAACAGTTTPCFNYICGSGPFTWSPPFSMAPLVTPYSLCYSDWDINTFDDKMGIPVTD